ncbi:MAG TPA: preprotein translocase subunit SecG [Thermoanaerobaculia bacterium]|nr:preprotein translocase subunit SecG [Thermoanaerobaculia bacterium]
MIYLFYAVHIVVCIFLILVVLLQQGKGADLSVFGGGSTQTAFGARSATTLLHKLTVTSFVLFICTTLLIGILQGGAGGSSIMSEVMEERLEETATGAAETAPTEVDPATPETGPPGGEAEAPLEVEAEGEPPAGEDGDGR